MNFLRRFVERRLMRRLPIPDEDQVTRSIYNPPMGRDLANLIWPEPFQFSSNNNYCESVIWREFVRKISRVHKIGCKRQRQLRAQGRDKTYTGALTAVVADIRKFRNQNDHGFSVIHEPGEGIHHAHIAYDLSATSQLTKGDKMDLRWALKLIFDEKAPHKCPEDQR